MACTCLCCCGCCCDGLTGTQQRPVNCASPKVHKGNGTVCGVCCVDGEPDPEVETEEECPGVWIVHGKCLENPCHGACCQPTFGCTVSSKADCLAISGATFVGEGTSCDPDPCTAPCEGIGPGFEPCGDRNCCVSYCDGIYDSVTCEECEEVTLLIAQSYGYADADEMCNDQLAINSPCYIGNSETLHVCRDDCVFTYCISSGLAALAVPPSGPGTELKKILAGFPLYIKVTPSCPCNARAKVMDKNERENPGWCEENIDTIVGWLREEHAKRKSAVPFIDMAVKKLIRIAIKRAKRGNSQ